MVPVGEQGEEEIVEVIPWDDVRKKGAARIAQSHWPIFEKAAGEIVKREREKVLENAKKHLGKRDLAGWNEWVEKYYRDFPQHFLKNKMLGVFFTLAGALSKKPDVSVFARKYNDEFSFRYVESSLTQLQAAVRKAHEEEKDELQAVTDLMEEWESGRPGAVATDETVRMVDEMAKGERNV
jgi:hypothetical protein